MASKQQTGLVLVEHKALVSAADVAAGLHVTRWNATVRDAQGNPIPGGYKAWHNAQTGERVAWLPVDPANDVRKPFAYALDLAQVPAAASVELSARAVSDARKAGKAHTERVSIPVGALKPAGVSKRAEAAKAVVATRKRDPHTGRLLPNAPEPVQEHLPAFAANASVDALADAIANLTPELQQALMGKLAGK